MHPSEDLEAHRLLLHGHRGGVRRPQDPAPLPGPGREGLPDHQDALDGGRSGSVEEGD